MLLGKGSFGRVTLWHNKADKMICMDEDLNLLHHIREWYIGRSIFPDFYKSVRLSKWAIIITMTCGFGYLKTKLLRMSKRKALEKIALQVALLHSQGIIHGDIKPTNIIMTKNGTDLQIVDFGASHIAPEPIIPVREMITRWYRPPEATQKYSIAADMWSIGCVWYELVHEKPLFGCENQIELDLCHERYFRSKPFKCPILKNLICRKEDRWDIETLLQHLNVPYKRPKTVIPQTHSELLKHFEKQNQNTNACLFATDAMFDNDSDVKYDDLLRSLKVLEILTLPSIKNEVS